MFLAKWYRKIAESANNKSYTQEDSKNRKANLLNNILLVPGIFILGLSLTSIFLWFYLHSLIYTARQELPALPYADVGHGMSGVSHIKNHEQLDKAIWIAILPGMWVGGVELVGWTQFRHIPFNYMEKIVCIGSARQIRSPTIQLLMRVAFTYDIHDIPLGPFHGKLWPCSPSNTVVFLP